MGVRLGCETPKALIDLAGQPMLVHTLLCFESLGLLEHAIIVVPEASLELFRETLSHNFPGNSFRFLIGGAERQASVWNGLQALAPETEVVVIHDAARPFVAEQSIRESMEAAYALGAATVAIPSVDTILEADENACLANTPDRRRLWACQTPQTFRVEVIRDAHQRARDTGYLGTDDATLVRRMNAPVKLVMGTPLNFKVTTPTDLALAELVIREGLA